MADADRGRLLTDIERKLAFVAGAANLSGALDLFFFALLLLPAEPDLDRGEVALANAALFVPYMALTLALGRREMLRQTERVRAWFTQDRDPTPEERDHALRLPLIGARMSARFWAGALVLFTALNLVVATEVAPAIPVLILLGGITTTAVDYLLTERILRPVTARALAGGPPEHPVGPGVRVRLMLVWASATGMPLLGIAATAVAGILGDDLEIDLLAGAVLFLAMITFGVGLGATLLSTRSIAEPLASVRQALERIEQGDYDAEVPVDDGSELGMVEAGFNRMAAGLRERERLRDVFGRHVGRDVARAALEGDLKLGGEVRDVGVLFVDVLGSTALAERLPPERVVTLLNEFFNIVVAVTEAHGGAVNKFEGDGALCVFGAPVRRDDPAGAALAAAREMRARLLDELPQVDAAVGVSAGEAVAGNVGAEQRFEYTVIGDPVNEASRLCELAKERPERVVASDAAIERADPREAARWDVGEATLLRGREAPTRIATVGGPPS
jgi:adenylate cyclase